MKIKHRYTRFGFSGFLLMLGLFVSAFILIYIADIIIIALKQKKRPDTVWKSELLLDR